MSTPCPARSPRTADPADLPPLRILPRRGSRVCAHSPPAHVTLPHASTAAPDDDCGAHRLYGNRSGKPDCPQPRPAWGIDRIAAEKRTFHFAPPRSHRSVMSADLARWRPPFISTVSVARPDSGRPSFRDSFAFAVISPAASASPAGCSRRFDDAALAAPAPQPGQATSRSDSAWKLIRSAGR